MKIFQDTQSSKWAEILKRPTFETKNLSPVVASILADVDKRGDQALLDFTEQFDGVRLSSLQVRQEEITQAIQKVDEDLKDAIIQAKFNIEKFHRSQILEPQVVETMPGVQCWRKSVPIQRVGLYIPGGTAPLFSTVLMLGVPAQIAGCDEVVLCTPPSKDGSIDPAILFTADLIGISKIYKVGGAQAIAAMTFGTATIPAVNKIFGPGNQYVTEAKQQAIRFGVAIDMPAGPSEVLIVADETALPEFVAADLLSQAEHGVDSQVVLVAFTTDFVSAVLGAVEKQLQDLPRKEITSEALKNSVAIILSDREEAADLVNLYAPEHLILALNDEVAFSNRIKNAGSVFLGNYTPESAGDYASGTNHTLPTNGFAKVYSGVSLDSFVKKITYQKISKEGLLNLGPVVEKMAVAEQLIAHKNAMSIRLNTIEVEHEKQDVADTGLDISDRNSVSHLIRQDLRDFKAYSSARDEYKGAANIFLDANENPFDTGLNRYPDPMQKELKEKIATLKKVNVDQIFLGNGSDEAIDLLIRLFCEAGHDDVLILPPTYGVYQVAAKAAGVKVKELPLSLDFQLDEMGVNSLSAKAAKIAFICNPNNPTGNVISIDQIKLFVQDFPGIVVVDEAYIDFSDQESCLSLINEFPNLVILQTFSKAWGLAGVRLGMAFANPDIITWLNRIKLPYNINQLTQKEVLSKLDRKREVDLQIQEIKDQRSSIAKALPQYDFVEQVFPSQTNFIMVRVKHARELYEFLLDKGIIVRDRSNQLNCASSLRITIGTAEENEQLINALNTYSEKLEATRNLIQSKIS